MNTLYEITIRQSDENQFAGRILVNEDGWFEGMIISTTSQYTKNRMIFGIYIPNQRVNCFLLSPENISSPQKYTAQKTKTGYRGDFSVIGSLWEVPYGECEIHLCPSELIREPLGNEEERLTQMKIDYLNSANKLTKEFYRQILLIKTKLLTQVQNQNEENSFSWEDIQALQEKQLACSRKRKPNDPSQR